MKTVSKLLSVLMYLLMHGFFSVDAVRVSVMEGDSVTLHTGVQMKRLTQKEEITWYFNHTLILTDKICIVCSQCSHFGERRFRNRLTLDSQTGSMTIRDIRTTDSGHYRLLINSINTKFFFVAVYGVHRDEMIKSVKEGKSVSLDNRVINKTNNFAWHFNETCIAEITRDRIKICTDVQCEDGTERFRDRLKLDHQTGSLTIMNIRNTDSGDYKLHIMSCGTIRITSFSVTVMADRTGICAAVSAVLLFLVASAGLIYSRKCHSRRKYIKTQRSHQADGVEEPLSNQTDLVEENTPNESSSNQIET